MRTVAVQPRAPRGEQPRFQFRDPVPFHQPFQLRTEPLHLVCRSATRARRTDSAPASDAPHRQGPPRCPDTRTATPPAPNSADQVGTSHTPTGDPTPATGTSPGSAAPSSSVSGPVTDPSADRISRIVSRVISSRDTAPSCSTRRARQLLDLPAQFSDPIPCSSLPPLQFLQPRHHRRLPATSPGHDDPANDPRQQQPTTTISLEHRSPEPGAAKKAKAKEAGARCWGRWPVTRQGPYRLRPVRAPVSSRSL